MIKTGYFDMSAKRSLRKCLYCFVEFQPKTTYAKYCSRFCSNIHRKTGMYKTCKICHCDFYVKKSRIESISLCSTECANKHQKRNKVLLTCKICKKEFEVSPTYAREHPENIKRYKVKYCSEKCGRDDPERNFGITGNLAQQNHKGPNKLEIAGKEILKDIQKTFKFTIKEQKPIANKFIVDVYIPKYKLIIQWDGDYWHGNPDYNEELTPKQIKRAKIDYSQNRYFIKCGYNVLRFWESEVKNSPQKVKEIIMNHMKDFIS